MIASRSLPQKYVEWNTRNGAPTGHPVRRFNRLFSSAETIERLRGPFAIQPNNSIRAFEYPWAFETSQVKPGMHVLEVGGGLGGFQFALDQYGCRVTNVDPGMDNVGWPCNAESMAKLNRRFRTNVRLINTRFDDANLPDASFDRIFCISVIEHLPAAEAQSLMAQAHRCLKADGLFVLTADLFLNLQPFCSRQSNEFGSNQNLKVLVDEKMWKLEVGDRSCLYGFPEFNADRIQGNLENYLIGYYPALAQCLALSKR